jgi:hypothetical protein
LTVSIFGSLNGIINNDIHERIKAAKDSTDLAERAFLVNKGNSLPIAVQFKDHLLVHVLK